MSKVKIEGNASGTGTLTISAPNTNTDRSLTLPDTAGEVVLKTSTGIDTNNNITIERSSDATKYSVIGMETGNLNFNTYNGNQTFSNSGTEAMRIDSSGNLLVGTTEHFNYSGGTTEITLGTSGTGATAGGAITFVSNNGATTLGYLGSQEADMRLGTMGSRNLLFLTDNTERMRVNSSGSVQLAFGGSYQGLSVSYTGGSTTYRASSDGGNGCHHFRSDVGSTYALKAYVQNNGSYYNASDYRLKENIADMSDGIDAVKQLRPVTFNMIGTEENVTGFIAHEVKEVIDHLVDGDKDQTKEEEYEITPAVKDDDGNVVTEAVMGTRTVPHYQFLNYAGIVPTLTQALKEAIDKIETLETTVADLTTRIETLENA